MLALVDLAGDDVVGATGRGSGAQPDLQEQLGVVPAHLLGSDDSHGARIGRGGQEPLEAVLSRSGVIMEQPEPHLVLRHLRGGLGGGHEPLLVGGDR